MSQNNGKTGGVLLRAVMMCVIGCISIAGAMAETYVLDMYQKADDPAGRKFRTAKAAIEALRDGTKSEPTILIVKPGVYWLDDPDDPEVRRPKEGDNGIPYAATLKASNLVIRGEEGAADRTIFAVNRGQTQGAVGNYTMLKVTGSDIRVENVTFGNYCNVDLVYKSNPRQKKRGDSAGTDSHLPRIRQTTFQELQLRQPAEPMSVRRGEEDAV